mgnify:CR=1 FL=1
MKRIYYTLKSLLEPDTEEVAGASVSLPYSDANLELAKQEAYNGEYTIADDGEPEVEAEPTHEERIAELEEALAMLLSGVTE